MALPRTWEEVQSRLNEHCYTQLTTYTIGGLAADKFALSWGFKNLLGALRLHIAWLQEAEGERVRRCKRPDCLRVIYFELGEPPADAGLKKNVRGRYKTRADREFCKGAYSWTNVGGERLSLGSCRCRSINYRSELGK